MALPTIVFSANSDVMKATAKRGRGGISDLSVGFHSHGTVSTAALFIFDSSFVDSRSNFIFAQSNMFAMQGRILCFTFSNSLRHRPTINVQ